MMHQWLSIVAIIASKPPPKPALVCPVVAGDTLFHVLFILALLALLGVLGGGIWMFRTGRWLVASYQNAPRSYRNYGPSAYRTPGTNYNPPVRRSSPPPTPRMQPEASPPARYTDAPASSARPPSPSMSPGASSTRSPAASTPAESQDDLLRDTRWLRLAQDCVYLFDELDENMANFHAPRREIARHVKTRLREILVHSNVEAIDRDPTFNENRHQLEQPGATVAPGTPIVSFVSPGFAVERRVLRRAVVRVASENEG